MRLEFVSSLSVHLFLFLYTNISLSLNCLLILHRDKSKYIQNNCTTTTCTVLAWMLSHSQSVKFVFILVLMYKVNYCVTASARQVKRWVGGETREVVIMPTKVRHLRGAAVIVATEAGRNKAEVLRSRRRSGTAEGSPGEGPAGNERAEERKVKIWTSVLLCNILSKCSSAFFSHVKSCQHGEKLFQNRSSKKKH